MNLNVINIYKNSYSGLTKRSWLLALGGFINRSGSMVLFFLVLYLTSQLKFSTANAGLMISVYGFGALGGALLGGWLSDVLGENRIQTISLLLNGAGFIVVSFIHHPVIFGIILFFTALIGEAFRPANATAMVNSCPPELRARGIALNRLAANLGVSIGPAVGGFLAAVNYKLLFWVDGATCILAAFFYWKILGPDRQKTETAHTGSKKSAVSPWKDTPFIFLLILILCTGLMFTQFFSTWPLYLKNIFGLLEKNIGMLVALNTLIITFTEMPLIHLLEKKNIFHVMAAGTFLIFIGFALLPLGSDFYYAAFTVVIWTIGEMLVFPLAGGYIANRADDSNRGKYMGLFTFTFALAISFGPAAGSFVYQYFSPDFVWLLTAIGAPIVTAGYIILKILDKRSPKIH